MSLRLNPSLRITTIEGVPLLLIFATVFQLGSTRGSFGLQMASTIIFGLAAGSMFLAWRSLGAFSKQTDDELDEYFAAIRYQAARKAMIVACTYFGLMFMAAAITAFVLRVTNADTNAELLFNLLITFCWLSALGTQWTTWAYMNGQIKAISEMEIKDLVPTAADR